MKNWSMKTQVYTGEDSLKRLELLKEEKICFVCDPYLIETAIFRTIMRNVPSSSDVSLFTEVIPDPPIETVAAGTRKMKGHLPTVLVAIGGGSAIDTAKAMLFTYQKMGFTTIQKFIAIPTTSGTGSEVTSASVVTDVQNKIKYPIFHSNIIPDEAILDAQLVLSSPPAVTAYSGMDVLTHALEALVAKKRSIYTDALAEKAIELVFNYLEICYIDGNNLIARKKMHEASCLAGLAFDKAGLGVCHALAHQIGAQFKVPHGLANLMLLPHVIEANSQDKIVLEKYSALSIKLGFSFGGLPKRTAVLSLCSEINKLSKKLGCPTSLEEFGIPTTESKNKISEIIKNAKNDQTYLTNPIAFPEGDLAKIYRKVL